jgi:hypothetical protein
MAFTKEVGGIGPWTSLYIYNLSLMIMQFGVLYVYLIFPGQELAHSDCQSSLLMSSS